MALTKDFLQELYRQQPDRFAFMSKFNAKSATWKDFELVLLDGILLDFTRCLHCSHFVTYSSKKGTGSMLRHRCPAKDCAPAEENEPGRSEGSSTVQRLARANESYWSTKQPAVQEQRLVIKEEPESDSSSTPILEPSIDVREGECPQNGLEAPTLVPETVLPTTASEESSRDTPEFYRVSQVVSERERNDLEELSRRHAEEEHSMKIELLRKQQQVADLQRQYWKLKVQLLKEKSFNCKSVDEDSELVE